MHTQLQRAALFTASFFAIACFAAPSQAAAVSAPPGFQVNTVAGGLAIPTSFAFAPDGRIFVAQKSGAIRLIKNGVLQATPVVQLSDVNDFADRGLEGIALDPNFASNGFMYLAYTFENTPGQNYTGFKTGRIVRLTVVGDTASLASKVVILGSVGGDAAHPSCRDFAVTADCIPSDANTHSMGALRFGPDGKLYATLGDGAGYESVDPLALGAQDIRSLGGKIVRINTNGTGVSDNPFWNGNPGANQSKVWVMGLRNPYRMNFRPGDGKVFFGDVGWTAWEEINAVPAKGANFGWPCREGHVATSYNCTPSTPATEAIHVYDHSAGSGSVIGGAFPSAYTQFSGNYFFGDYSNSFIKRMVLNANDTVASVNDFVTGADGPVDIQVGPDGNLWYLALNVGELRKIVLSSANRPPVAAIAANPTSGSAPLPVHFSAAGSSDPDGDPVTYAWTFGDGASGAGQTIDHTYAANGSYTATLTVLDNKGGSGQATALVSVGSVPAGSPDPHHVQTTIAPDPVVIGHEETITVRVRNEGDPAPFVVDIEIYDASVNKVAQKVFENQTIAKGATADHTMTWLPPAVGDYVVKVGLFKQGWSGLWEWTDRALAVTVLNRSPGTTTPPAEPAFSQQTSVSPASPASGGTAAVSATVANAGGDADALVDIEVYRDGTKVGQKFFDNQHISAGASLPLQYDFAVPSAGTYKVSVGIFKPGWSALYNWFDSVATFTTGGGTTPSTIDIYQDALAAGWENWSWGTTVNLSDTAQKASGANSIRVTYTSGWGGLFLHAGTPVSTAGKTSLTFAVAGAGASGQNLQLYMFDSAGTQLTIRNLAPYISGGITAGAFKTVTILLADLGASGKTVSGIVLQDASGAAGQSVYVDTMQLQEKGLQDRRQQDACRRPVLSYTDAITL